MLGLRTNRDYLLQALSSPAFTEPRLATRWLGEASGAWVPRAPDGRWAAIVGALLLRRRSQVHGPLALWSSVGPRETPLRLQAGAIAFDLRLAYRRDEPVRVTVADAIHTVEELHADGPELHLAVDGVHVRASFCSSGSTGWLDAGGACEAWTDLTDAPPQRADGAGHGLVASRMHGLLVRLAVAAGQRVKQGDFLLAIEAMKMEHRIEAPIGGTVAEVGAAEGTQVSPGRLLVRIEPEAAT